jgi:ATP-binding cassette subfamily B multidrug efflux pump
MKTKLKYKLLTDYMKKHKYSYLIGFLFMFTASYVQTFFPRILGNTIDLLKLPNFIKNQILVNIGFLLIVSFSVFVLTYIWRNVVIGNSRKLECSLREKLYAHFQILSPEFYTRQKTGDLIAYAINDISAVRMAFGPATAMSVNGFMICAVSIYFMATTIDWRLTALTILPIPLLIVIMMIIGNKIRAKFKVVQKTFGEISDRVQENINGIRVIKAYVQEEKEIEKFEMISEKMLKANVALIKTSSLLAPIIEICFSFSFFLNLIIGGNLVLRGSISLGDFVAFNTYLAMIIAPIVTFGRVVNQVQRGLVSIVRLNYILSVKTEIKDKPGVINDLNDANIEFNNLTFHYPGRIKPALKNINLKIEKGKTVGIIGKTGSGKSTLANLLVKLYNANNGEIALSGIDINNYSIEAVRNNFGYVPQETFLFSATIKENIVFFKEGYSEEEIIEASKFSRIYDSILNFPEGLNTILGERGINLSGGQKQRIALARALIRNPSVLILDDSLSAVDTVTEAEILNNFKNIRKGKTNIVISHRISAVRDSDEIIVLNKGCIEEKGTHEELIEKKGLYYEIYVEQNKEKARKAI